MGVTLRTNANIAFQCAYHVVWCSKYRRKVIGGRMETRLKEVIVEVVEEKGAWLIELETMPDHVHLLVEVDPQLGIHKLVKAITEDQVGFAGRVGAVNRRHARVRLPKLGWVKFRSSGRLDGELIRSATLTREGRNWYLSLLVEDGVVAGEHARPEAAVGVDRGVAVAVATNTGELIDRSFTIVGERARATALQRRLSRTAKGSANRNKARAALAEVHARERRRREDFCRKTAHRLAQANALVVLEKLQAKNMTRRAKPVADPDKPGCFLPNGGAAKSGLNKAILAKGWHQFELALNSVSRYTGTTVVKVRAAFTSQRCSACGHVDPKSRESQAVFRCTHCSHNEHADVNAAKNILAAGLAVTACEDHTRPSGRVRSVKQEPAGNREGSLLQPVT